jgi:hypothetical protein
MQVDIFSFGVILMEVFAKSVTGAALLTVGDMEECEMYAWKVRLPFAAIPTAALAAPVDAGLQAGSDAAMVQRPRHWTESAHQSSAKQPSTGSTSRYPCTKALTVLQVAHGYRRPIPLWFPPQLGALIVECWDEDPDRWAPPAVICPTCSGHASDHSWTHAGVPVGE